MNLREMITAVAACCVLTMTGADYKVVPASGTYASLEDFVLTFPEATKVENCVTGYGNAVKLVPEGKDPASFSGNFCFKMSAEGNSVTYGFNSAFTTEGSYNLYIPKSAVKVDGSMLEEDLLIPYKVGEDTPENPEEGILTVDGIEYSLSPVQGEVSVIDEIVITFPKASTLAIGTLNWGNAPRLVKKGLDPTSSANCNFCFRPKVNGNSIEFPLQKVEEKPGEYDFYLSAGVVIVDGSPLTTDLKFEYKVKQADYKLEAVGENELDEISSLVLAVTPEAEVTLPENSESLVLVNNFTKEEYTGEVSAEGNKINVIFNPAIDTPASYSLTVPEGFFMVNGEASNRDWTFDYRIKGTGDFTYTITPEEGAVVELESFEIEFEGSELSVGNISSENNPLLLRGTSRVPVDIEARITGQVLSLKLSMPVASKGEYTLIIPRGLIKLNGETPENDLRFNYTVDPIYSTILEISVLGNEAEYFNLQGVKVSEPRNGIYIRRENGEAKKVMRK